MDISFHSEGTTFQLKQKIKHRHWVIHYIKSLRKVPGEISIIFTSNEQLRLMNREYLNHDYFTDVITFDYTDGEKISGDIFISIDQVRINADFYGVHEDDELRRVMIHGVLHLLNFKDSNAEEKRTMHKKENEALHLWLKLV